MDWQRDGKMDMQLVVALQMEIDLALYINIALAQLKITDRKNDITMQWHLDGDGWTLAWLCGYGDGASR